MQGGRVPKTCRCTLYTALAHTLQHSASLTEGVLLTRLAQFRAHNSHDRRDDAIENT